MKKIRPVNLSLLSIKFPITAIVSISHRITGVLLFLSIPLLLWLLNTSLQSPAGFISVKQILANFWLKSILWAFWVALFVHVIFGIRHLLMDMGIGETLRGGRFSAQLVIVISILFAIAAGVCIW